MSGELRAWHAATPGLCASPNACTGERAPATAPAPSGPRPRTPCAPGGIVLPTVPGETVEVPGGGTMTMNPDGSSTSRGGGSAQVPLEPVEAPSEAPVR